MKKELKNLGIANLDLPERTYHVIIYVIDHVIIINHVINHYRQIAKTSKWTRNFSLLIEPVD